MTKQDLDNFLMDIKADREHKKLGELSEFRKEVLASKEAIYKHLTLYGVVKSLKDKEIFTFEEMLKDKYIRINDNLFQNRNYHYRKTRKELLEMYNAIGQLL